MLQAGDSERFELLSAQLRRGVEEVLTLGSGPGGRADAPDAVRMDVGLDQSLVDIGVDSLMAMGLKKQVRAVLGVNVPLSAVLKGGTVRSLTELIMERLQEEQAAAAADAVVKNAETTSAEPADDLLAQLRQLPESEALALLEKESR